MKHFHERFPSLRVVKLRTLWRNFPGIIFGFIVFCSGCVLITVFATRIGDVQEQVNTLVTADRDQSLWAATQIQVELLEFEKLVQTAKTSPAQYEDDVRADFDVLYSRISQVSEPNIESVFRAEGDYANVFEIINLRDRMAAIVDLNDKLGNLELNNLAILSMKAHHLWKQSIALVLQEAREHKIFVRKQAVETLQSVQTNLWVALTIATALPALVILMLFLRARYKEARSYTLIDALTSCATRKGLQDALKTRFSKAKNGFSVAVVDINNLKMVNDQFGHQAGDLLIQSVGVALTKVTRGIDCTARIGGDEFILLLDASVEQAELILRRAQDHLEEMSVTEEFGVIPMQVSFGVAYCADSDDFDEAISLADQRMYRQKEAGKKEQPSFTVEST